MTVVIDRLQRSISGTANVTVSEGQVCLDNQSCFITKPLKDLLSDSLSGGMMPPLHSLGVCLRKPVCAHLLHG